jgi:hypothetical protein
MYIINDKLKKTEDKPDAEKVLEIIVSKGNRGNKKRHDTLSWIRTHDGSTLSVIDVMIAIFGDFC